ncbi:MAG TPA: ATPase [Rhodospirillaceae bacterium]|nr:ATPase [Rhodospirillaceae bacterium]
MIRRHYSTVAVVPIDDAFGITLDGKALATPGRRPLRVPTLGLAEALAAEWRDQGEEIRPQTMPLNQLVNTAIDRIAPERDALVEGVLVFGAADLLCYRAEAPRDLAERQDALWQPIVDWAAGHLGAAMVVTTSLTHQTQPAAALARLAEIVAGYDLWRLTALQSAVPAMGSLLLGIALVEGKIDAEAAHRAAQLDELYQAERWGEDYEAVDRRNALLSQVAAAATLLYLTRLC